MLLEVIRSRIGNVETKRGTNVHDNGNTHNRPGGINGRRVTETLPKDLLFQSLVDGFGVVVGSEGVLMDIVDFNLLWCSLMK